MHFYQLLIGVFIIKTIISGSRSVFDYKLLVKILQEHDLEGKITEVVCGDTKGMEKCGETWAKQNDIKIKHIPAEWDNLDAPGVIIREGQFGKYNAKAGFDKNRALAKYADNAVVVIQGEDVGSDSLIQEMEKLGKEVFVYEL